MKVMSIDFIGERLKELRFKRNIKQKDLAKKLGISQAQVARYESYQNRPSFAMVKLMAMVLDTTTEYLLGETEEDKENKEIETLEKKKEDYQSELIELQQGSGKKITADEIQKEFERYTRLLKGSFDEKRELISKFIDKIEIYKHGYVKITGKKRHV
jgi:transcriptional regulator with XRE-family HTH domain